MALLEKQRECVGMEPEHSNPELAEQRAWHSLYDSHSGRCGSKRWEEQQPEAGQTLLEIAEAHGQQDPTFKITIAYTRLRPALAIEKLKQRGYGASQLPEPSKILYEFLKVLLQFSI